jgi:AraC-like DNA-binding protein
MIRGSASHKVQLSTDAPTCVIACGLDPIQMARITDAVRSSAVVTTPRSLEELYERLHDGLDQVDLVVIGTRQLGSSIEEVVRNLRAARPRVPVVAYLSSATADTCTIPGLTEAGVNEIIVPGYNDERAALRAAVMAARRGCAAHWALRSLGAVLPSELRPFAERILADPTRITTVPELARRVGVNRKTVFNWCRRAGFVGPGELISWCRLALVAYYLETTRCSVDTIARDLGYPSATTLRNTLRRHVKTTATQLREDGGLAFLVAAMHGAINKGSK